MSRYSSGYGLGGDRNRNPLCHGGHTGSGALPVTGAMNRSIGCFIGIELQENEADHNHSIYQSPNHTEPYLCCHCKVTLVT
jgi:hypothetical protein